MPEIEFEKGRRDLSLGDPQKVLCGVKAVFFDLDGTLVDSIGTIIECTRCVFSLKKLPIPSDSAILKTIGTELSDGLTSLLPPERRGEGQEVTAFYRQVANADERFKIDKLFPDLEPLFAALKGRGLKLAFASGRSRRCILNTLSATFLGGYSDGVCGGDEVPSKPAPDMALKLCETLGVKPAEVLGVGDADLDILMYQRAGCKTLAVSTGVWSGQALESLKPDLLLPRASDLFSYL